MDIQWLDRLRLSFITYSVALIILLIYTIIYSMYLPKYKFAPHLRRHILFIGISYLIALICDIYDTLNTLGTADLNWLHMPRFVIQYVFGLLGMIPLTLHLHKKEYDVIRNQGRRRSDHGTQETS